MEIYILNYQLSGTQLRQEPLGCLDPSPFQQKNKLPFLVVPSLFKKGVPLTWKGVVLKIIWGPLTQSPFSFFSRGNT